MRPLWRAPSPRRVNIGNEPSLIWSTAGSGFMPSRRFASKGVIKPQQPSRSTHEFQPYTPPNEGAGLLTVDRDLCWRINPRGLVTPAVIGAVCWARNNFLMVPHQHHAILTGLGLECHQLPNGATVLQPQLPYRLPPASNKAAAEYFNLTNPQLPLHHYDAVEVYPCVEGEGGIERFEASEHSASAHPHFWSVALHLEVGHTETIADFPGWTQAEAFGDVMREILRSARKVEGRDTTHL